MIKNQAITSEAATLLKIFEKLFHYLKSVFAVVGLCTAPKFAVISFALLAGIENKEDLTKNDFSGLYIFAVLVLAPLLETLWNQAVFSWVNTGLENRYRLKITIFSALLFSLMHWDRPIESLLLFFWIGLCFQHFYIKLINAGKEAYWVIAASHSLINLVSLGFGAYFAHVS